MASVQARSVSKTYGSVKALNQFDFDVQPGRIVGLIGPNGSGKTTALKALLGLIPIDSGELSVLGNNPSTDRAKLMQHVAYIADTGILPRWMRVRDLLSVVSGLHATFDRKRAEEALKATDVRLDAKIRALSKGMHVQLHLAIILAIDAQLLVLDEPTLGLDILHRQRFYAGVLGDYYNEERSIIITTHEVREIEHLLTDVVFIHQGRAHLSLSMESLRDEFAKLLRPAGTEAPKIQPLYRRQSINGFEEIYRNVPRSELIEHGEVSTPNLAEIFVGVIEGSHA